MITRTGGRALRRPSVVAAVVTLAADQITKAVARPRALTNPETLLGIVPTGSTATTVAATTGVLLVAIWVVARQVASGRCSSWLASVPLAGAASNLVDRLLHGAVIDWLTVGGFVVNLADIAIVAGSVAVALKVRRVHLTTCAASLEVQPARRTTW